MTDVVVLGLGPAGRAVAHRALTHGLHVVAVDPHPDRRWTPTYAAWADELPKWLPENAIATRIDEPEVWTTRRQVVPRPYCVLDTGGLQDALDVSAADTIADRAVRVDTHSVRLASGETVSGDVVIDARGTARRVGVPEQTAFGVIVDADAAAPALESASAWFMDWRSDNGANAGETSSFLYAVPLADDHVLLEETCLVGHPPLSLDILRTRLEHRLGSRGIALTGAEKIERVRFPVDAPAPRTRAVIDFGARAGLMHPGTGYSVAASLAAADSVAGAVVAGRLPRLWTADARAVHALRRAGLRTLLALDSDRTAQFFAEFFELPIRSQQAYLSGRSDLTGTMRTMGKLFRSVPFDVRRTMVGSVVSSGNRSQDRKNSTIMGA